MTATRHILSLSGGKDSAALAIYMRDKVPEMEYIFHDTEMELPETYEYLYRLEAYLGKPIQKTRPDVSFEKWLDVFQGMIPSNHRRWCTKLLKLKPFESYVADDQVINYVGLRADEEREGYISGKSNIRTVYPFREDGLVKADIVRILEESGLGMPTYTDWGRTRSGCFFCFYQQKIEWVRLKERHPDLFEKAKEYEFAQFRERYNRQGTLNPFYWSGDEPLSELEKPERVREIKRKFEKSKEKARLSSDKLVQILGGADLDDDEREGCLICQI
jgi:3'-phosphoadenosine 5'-phosphosulfate sulfotransferase (PAPS reductase)/FAD synthetase